MTTTKYSLTLSEEEIRLGLELFNLLLVGGDPSVIIRRDVYRGLHRKFQIRKIGLDAFRRDEILGTCPPAP